MKYNFFLPLILLVHFTKAQPIEARYKVVSPVIIPTGPGMASRVLLEYEGFYYRSGGNNIYFQKPLYLEKYPSGQILIENAGRSASFELITDSLQRIGYNNTDSMVFRFADDNSGGEAKNYFVRQFEWNAQVWQLLPETRIINGLKCQRARQFSISDSTKLVWDLWFCPEVDVSFGPSGIRDLPGLVVEARSVPNDETYLLQSFVTNAAIPAGIFWPEEFYGAVFKQLKPLQKKLASKKTNAEKRLEIMNQ